ncbi:MAG: HlyD family type I secretion periplasmic adaptor subunit [Burkholderiales bacterium]|nr:HlyD family type I secretion periplasmic adaptor subunit [Burkholderiales bacterium]
MLSSETFRPDDPFAKGRRIGRIGLLSVVALMIVALGWLATAPLSAAAIVSAQVKVESYRRPIQHLEGGQVQEVLVRAGDQVREGQPLVRLGQVAAESSFKTIEDQLNAEHVRLARAKAERANSAELKLPQAIERQLQTNPVLAEAVAAERALLASRRKLLEGQITELQGQAQQVRQELSALQDQLSSSASGRKLLAAELAIQQDLLSKEFVHQTRVMESQRALAERDERTASVRVEEAKARQKLSELSLRLAELRGDAVRRASDEIAEVHRNLAELEERIRPLKDALARQVLTAPIAGTVVDLKVHGNGVVIAPRETLMEIVPQSVALVFEGRLMPEDVGDVAVGQPVDIQVTAFRQRDARLLRGTVTYVAADATVDASGPPGTSHYLVRVVAKSEAAPTQALSAGMPAVLFIQTKARTALDYLLQPLTDAMRHAMRER